MIQYTIGELENILKVKFPESFHKIYDTGAMQWLTRKDDETEISADSFFYNLDWDFNMLKFSKYLKRQSIYINILTRKGLCSG